MHGRMGMNMDEDRAVLVGAGETRHVEELGRLATTLGMEVWGFSSRTGETARVIWAVASGRSFVG